MRIALVGTRGVPARYGGFETCIEEVGARLVEAGHQVLVYCRSGNADNDRTFYRGMRLVHLPAARRRSLETLSHTGLSVTHVLQHRPDVAIVFNAANAPFLPIFRTAKVPVATHVDGLEWQRAKWGPVGKKYYRFAESWAVRWSNALIADAQGIADYYQTEFNAVTHIISYGAPKIAGNHQHLLAQEGLRDREYHLIVARFEPENHVELMVRAYANSNARHPLVVVGSAPYADEYTAAIEHAADDRVRLMGGVWDQDLLDQLYASCLTYLHGHSVGGTNPSLLRALGAAAPICAFDVGFNREVARDSGRYFRTPSSLTTLIEAAEDNPSESIARGRSGLLQASRYDWDTVAGQYEDLCRSLATHTSPVHIPVPRRAHGRRIRSEAPRG